ncbi:MAG: VCBS repeat-containing protein [Deltaproteobacteria bacterium]|nr:VCBS repeat-containing protein [Deltaproteobacteria bacterium]
MPRAALTALALLAAALTLSPLSACGDDAPPAALRFRRVTFDADAYGPAFTTVADLNGDGRLDIAVSGFGPVQEAAGRGEVPPGEVAVYYQGASLAEWRREVALPREAGVRLPQELTVEDVDGDGDADIALGSGFLLCGLFSAGGACGGLLWLERRDGEWVRRDVLPPNQRRFYHTALFADLDGDGVRDLITVAEDRRVAQGFLEQEAEAQWFRGDAALPARFEATPRVIGPGLGSLPSLRDMDGDGDLDVVSAEYFAGLGASLAWYEQVRAPVAGAAPSDPLGYAGEWRRHVIDAESGPAIQGSWVPELFGPGSGGALVGSNHTNTLSDPDDPREGVFALESTADPRAPWRRTQLSAGIQSQNPAGGQAAPGPFGWGDADGDGDVDLLVLGDADPRVFLLEQRPGREFVTHVLDEGLPQAGGGKVVDLDGDGAAELLVSSFEGDAIYLYVRDSSGAHPLATEGPAAPAAPPPPRAPKDALFTVEYDGPARGDVRALLFEGDVALSDLRGDAPPAPLAAQTLTAPTFPLSVDFKGLAPARHTVFAYLDLGAPSPGGPGDEDLGARRAFTPPSLGRAPLTLGLVQEEAPAETRRPARVSVTVRYAPPLPAPPPPGGLNLVVGFYEREPIAGPPSFPRVTPVTRFPQELTFEGVPGGRYFAYAFLDLVEPYSTFYVDPLDASGQSPFFEVDGEDVRAEVELAVP